MPAASGSGSFDSTSCTLVQLGGNQSRCAVHYTPSASGPQTITGSYSGDPSSAPSTGTATLNVAVAVSHTSVSCSPAPDMVGTPTACTATVTGQAPSGTVTFSSNASGTFDTTSCTLATTGNTGTCSVNYTPKYYGTGTHRIYANYGGDANNASSHGYST